MTQGEEDQIIAGMVRERRELRRSLICIQEQIRQSHNGFMAACEAVRSMESRRSLYFPENAAYPPIADFRELPDRYSMTKARIAQLTIQIDAC